MKNTNKILSVGIALTIALCSSVKVFAMTPQEQAINHNNTILMAKLEFALSRIVSLEGSQEVAKESLRNADKILRQVITTMATLTTVLKNKNVITESEFFNTANNLAKEFAELTLKIGF